MTKVNCIKAVKTKKGLGFKKGESYEFTIFTNSSGQTMLRVYVDNLNSVVIKGNTAKRYFA